MAKQARSERNGKLKTGVSGLNRILNGGLPGRNLFLLQGEPGTGKTTMALQFLRAGVDEGEKALYVSLSQTKSELETIAASHDWSLDGIEIEELWGGPSGETDDQTIFPVADVRLDKTRTAVEAAIERLRPDRIVYDSLLEIRQLSRDGYRFRREMLAFKRFLAERDIAALFIDLTPEIGGDGELESISHGIIRLEKWLPEYGDARRRIEVRKMRGVDYFAGYHDMSIRKADGVRIYPRVIPALAPEARRNDLIKSDVKALDEMLGGGMEPGTTTLVVGQPGTGKSTMASLYAEAALKRGESVALFLFEERVETFFRRSEGLGMKLREFADEGLLKIWDFNPAEISPGEFSQIVQSSVEKNSTRVVLIDSFTGYLNALPHSNQAVMQIQTLLKFLSRSGVLSILVVAQHGLLGHNMETEVDVSFVGDTVIFLRMYEWPAVIRRTITVVKKRHGPHDLDVRELLIQQDGIRIQPFNSPPPGSPSPPPHE